MQQRQTKIHKNQAKELEPTVASPVYKFVGIEYLPEGFLELEPILYKDDYKFDSSYHEELFTKEQAKAKGIRQKQYMLRN